MGLGKTLSIISLLAADWVQAKSSVQWALHQPTLLIVPFPLLGSWEKELSQHLHPNTLTWWRFYGSKRHNSITHMLKNDVVLTTYDMVAKEWQNLGQTLSPLFSTRWRRVVVDEGMLKSPGQT